MTPARNETELTGLGKLLKSVDFWTASEVADRMSCSRMVAYMRLQALADRGLLETQMKRVGATGPMAKGYRMKLRMKRKSLKCGRR